LRANPKQIERTGATERENSQNSKKDAAAFQQG
jgi:hypothetical protein